MGEKHDDVSQGIISGGEGRGGGGGGGGLISSYLFQDIAFQDILSHFRCYWEAIGVGLIREEFILDGVMVEGDNIGKKTMSGTSRPPSPVLRPPSPVPRVLPASMPVFQGPIFV